MQYLIFGSIFILALGLLTSTSLLALSHILIIIPGIYFLKKTNFKALPKSAWAFLAMILVIIISVLVTQDIAVKGYKPILKAKYFLIGFLSIVPFTWYFKNHFNKKHISVLLYTFLIATTLASLSGMGGIFFGYNLLLFKHTADNRNGGLFGMIMNYAHNMSYFLIILVGLTLYRKEVEEYVNKNLLWGFLLINLAGFYITYTRGAWLGLIAGVPFYFYKNNKKAFLAVIGAMVICGAAAYFLAGDSMIRKDNDATRLGQWQAAVAAFKERPFFGYGYLNFEEHSSEIKHRYNLLAPDFKGHAHNNFFEMLGSTGGIGFLCFVIWLGFWFMEMGRRSDVVARLTLPFIITFVVGGLTQSTISLGINLFFIVGVYALSSADCGQNSLECGQKSLLCD